MLDQSYTDHVVQQLPPENENVGTINLIDGWMDDLQRQNEAGCWLMGNICSNQALRSFVSSLLGRSGNHVVKNVASPAGKLARYNTIVAMIYHLSYLGAISRTRFFPL